MLTVLFLLLWPVVLALLTAAQLWTLRGVLPGVARVTTSLPLWMRALSSWGAATLLLAVVLVQEITLEQRIDLSRYTAAVGHAIPIPGVDFGVALFGSAIATLAGFGAAAVVNASRSRREAPVRSLAFVLLMANGVTALPLTFATWFLLHMPAHW